MLHTPFSRAVLGLKKIPQSIVSQWYANVSIEYFERLVENYKNVVWHIINYNFKRNTPVQHNSESSIENDLPVVTYEQNLECALKMLHFLFQININQRSQRVAYEIFYLHELAESVNLQQDYFRWSQNKVISFKSSNNLSKTNQIFSYLPKQQTNEFFLCRYPYLFDAKAKTLLLQTDQFIQMREAVFRAQYAMQQNILYCLLGREPENTSEFVVFNVTRENIVQDTIREICSCKEQDLKKPLKVKFCGEEAEDAGGVRKEFFMLLIKDLLDQKYGMFREFEDSRLLWFSEHSFEEVEMYKLIGTLVGLAIYNFTIIYMPFPLSLYKKLLKEKVELNDLCELSPALGNSMKNILEYDGDDMEDVFDLTFEVSREVFGQMETIQLKPGGDKIRLNQENK